MLRPNTKSNVKVNESFRNVTWRAELLPAAFSNKTNSPSPARSANSPFRKMSKEGETRKTALPPNAPPPPPPAAVAAAPSECKVFELNGHVGFDSLPHQLVKKHVDQGFQFNLMCVGEAGTGKTTLIESLFNMKLEFDASRDDLKQVELYSKTYDVSEGGIRLKMTIVETAGFGDGVDKEKSANYIVDYINDKFESYLKEELKVRRLMSYYDDTRIHACLYFISPTGKGLKSVDVVTLRALSQRVNVIPVIAKADTTCREELTRFKQKILSELRSHHIDVYHFPTDDEAVAGVNEIMNATVPFAVVGSTEFYKNAAGLMVRARKYAWGMVEVENEQHCEFIKLREALLRTNVESLRQRTHTVLYENYRRERLRAMHMGGGESGPKMVEALITKERDLNMDLARAESAMREDYTNKLQAKEKELRDREDKLEQREREVESNAEYELSRLEKEIRALLDEKTKLVEKHNKKLGKRL